MLRSRQRSDAPALSLRMQAARHLYTLGYRVTGDGRLSRPKHGIEPIDKVDQAGPATSVFLVCDDGLAREVRMPYSTLAAMSFYGPDVLRPNLRVRFSDGDKCNLRRANVFVDEKAEVARLNWGRAQPLPKKKRAAYAEEAARLRTERPELFDRERCRVLAYAVDTKMTTLDAAAERLRVSVGIATSMLLIGRAELAKRRA